MYISLREYYISISDKLLSFVSIVSSMCVLDILHEGVSKCIEIFQKINTLSSNNLKKKICFVIRMLITL